MTINLTEVKEMLEKICPENEWKTPPEEWQRLLYSAPTIIKELVEECERLEKQEDDTLFKAGQIAANFQMKIEHLQQRCTQMEALIKEIET